MNIYDDDYDDRFRNPLAAYKPVAWGTDRGMTTPAKPKQDLSSDANLPKKKMFAKNRAKSLTSLHGFGDSQYNKI